MYIYLDESGDLGFDFEKDGTSDFFLITLLVCRNAVSKKAFQIAVRKTIRNKLKGRKISRKKIHELKGAKSSFAVKDYFFKKLKSDKWDIYTVILNKRRVYKEFWNASGQGKIYNFLARFIIEKLPLAGAKTNVRLVVDKSKNREEVLDFNQYIRTYIESSLPLNTNFSVVHRGSHEDPGLQAVDVFCWGIYRKYISKDLQWYNVYANKIRYENIYLP